MVRMVLQLMSVFAFWIALMPLASRLGASPAGAARLACAGAGLTLLGYGLLPGRRPATVAQGPAPVTTGEGEQRTTV